MSSELAQLWEGAGGQVPLNADVVPFESLLAGPKAIAVGVMYPGEHCDDGVPLIKVGDIKGGRIPAEPKFKVSQAVNTEYQRTQLRGDELLITLVGEPGACVVATSAMKGWNPARAIAVARLKDPSLRTYVKAVLESRPGKHLIDSVLNTTVQKTLNLKDIRQLPVPLPARSVVDAVSQVVDALDDRITLLRETNATLEAIAQALFKSWFVDFDPVRAKMAGRAPEGMDEATAALFPDALEETELGLTPTGWHVTKLGAAIQQRGGVIQTGPFGSQLHASDYAELGTPVAMPKDLDQRRISEASIARVADEHVQRLSKHQLKAGDILFSRRGDVERHALITTVEQGWLCGTGCLLVRPGAEWRWPTFLSMHLDTPAAKAWLVQHAVGATMPNLNTGILSSVPMLVPSIELMDRFEGVVAEFEKKRSENFAMIGTLSAMRDALLPRLISGQLRPPEAQAQLEDAFT